MKRKTPKEILAESFVELSANKNVERITIREIAENCGYSPATFYRHFRDKYDLIAWQYSRFIEENVQSVGTDGDTWRAALLRGVYHQMENREYLANLFKHTTGIDSFERYMAEVNFTIMWRIVLYHEEKPNKTLERCLWIYCYGCVKDVGDWLMSKYEATPEQIVEIYEEALPEQLKKYFLRNESLLRNSLIAR